MFRCPLTYYGRKALARVSTLKGKRAMIVTDGKIRELGFVAEVENQLKKSGFEAKVFDEVEPDPRDTTVSKCAQAASEFKPDLFIGLGGGSPIDVAKGAFLLYERPDVKLSSVSLLTNYGLRKKSRLAAIPTTSGTGSEVSCGMAIADSKSGRKMTLTSFELIPDTVVLDPQLAFRMPPSLRADSGLDALAHAIEGYVATVANEFTNASATRAIQSVFRHLVRSFKTGEEKAMEQMHYAATLAGLAMSFSGLGIAHSIGHAIGSVFHIPHGRAVGLALPYTIEYTGRQSREKYFEIAQALHIQGAALENSALKLSEKVKELMAEIQEPSSIRSLGIDERQFRDNLTTMAAFAGSDICTFTSPRIPTTKEFTMIIEHMLNNKSIDF